jgi:hypothetical protein
MSQLPVKFRIIQAIYESKQLSNIEILQILKKEYPLDRSIKANTLEQYLLSLKVVGIIEQKSATVDFDDELIIYYKITDYGVSRMKYIK